MKLNPSTTLYKQAASVLVLVAAALVLGTLAGSAGAAGSPFVAIDLGTPGGSSSFAFALNNAGQVFGFGVVSGDQHVFSWTPAGGIVDIGDLGSANDVAFLMVNDTGRVAGSIRSGSTGDWHAFSWTQAGGMVNIGTLGGNWSEPRAISNTGYIAGDSATASGGDQDAFLWTPAGGIVDTGVNTYSTSAVNDAGQVVGAAATYGGVEHAFSWTPAGGIVDLSSLGGGSSFAVAVSNTGEVIGNCTLPGASCVFSWTQAGGMVDLGRLSGPRST